ncbi:MAG: hypothetical protein BZY75_01410 [SAR202 cluster bacterium Io17-Chloro-G7]|nr:MAG: hypothetical protein BZY75_01410 [SAR202 cluster bacterium Io17-Chloro-G7]
MVIWWNAFPLMPNPKSSPILAEGKATHKLEIIFVDFKLARVAECDPTLEKARIRSLIVSACDRC